jgi:hypothetical protein
MLALIWAHDVLSRGSTHPPYFFPNQRGCEGTVERSKWEYMTLMLSATSFWGGGRLDGQALTNRLNELGVEGWELVSVFDTNQFRGETRDVVAVLKRSLQA